MKLLMVEIQISDLLGFDLSSLKRQTSWLIKLLQCMGNLMKLVYDSPLTVIDLSMNLTNCFIFFNHLFNKKKELSFPFKK